MADAAAPLVPDEPPASRRRKRGAGRNLPAAIATGVGLAAVLIAALLLARLAFLGFVLVIVLLGLAELVNVLRARGILPARPVIYPVAVLLLVGAFYEGTAALSFGLLVALVGAFAWYLVDRQRTEVTRSVAATLLATVYLPFMAGHLVLVVARGQHYVGAVLGYATLVVVYDTAAYAVGATLGRHPIAPSVSPNKSWEGLAGATLVCLAAGALLLPRWVPWTLASGLVLAAVTCVLAPLGDLAESMLKRDLAVKDMGSILPGHGGILDRMDALLFVAPALYYVLALFNLISR